MELKDEEAVFNDVAMRLMRLTVSALMNVARRKGPEWCWCEVAIGNPMFRGVHDLHCLQAQLVINNLPADLK